MGMKKALARTCDDAHDDGKAKEEEEVLLDMIPKISDRCKISVLLPTHHFLRITFLIKPNICILLP